MSGIATQSPAAARAAAGLPGGREIQMGHRRQATFFLDALFGRDRDHLIEIRTLGGAPTQSFFHDPRVAAVGALDAADVCDVYVGVLPRRERAGGKGALVGHSHWMWAECDTQMAVERAMSMSIPPSLTVRSSRGKAHCYWPLRVAVPLDRLELGNKRLAHHLGADPKATDAARILRVPGTLNHKYDEPQQVVITHLDLWAGNVNPGELVGGLPDPAPPRPLPIVRPRRASYGPDLDKDRLLAIPSREYIYALSGREVLRNMACCPFHKGGNERSPSLHVGGPELTLWHCFGCDMGGDIFTFAALLWGLDSHNDFPAVKRRVMEALR